MKRLRRLLLILIGIVLVLIVGAAGTAWWAVHGSLPELDARIEVAGLRSATSISRDALGTAVIEAQDRADAAWALGFVHAQERFFEMDLLRRRAAGELSALFGAAALPVDRAARVHRFRHRVRGFLADLPAADRALLNRYVEGVNSGLSRLSARPFPYLLLQQTPQPWLDEDSLLAPLAMFFDLQGGTNERELKLERMRAVLAPSVFNFLTAAGTDWDAPLLGEAMSDPPFPREEELDLRGTTIADPPADSPPSSEGIGSNNFAVDGAHSLHGGAILANDMHLGLRVPSLWFRTQLRLPAGRVVTGLSLPGTPLIVVGSNGSVAWGFTNSYGDWMDFIEVRMDSANAERYLTPQGWKAVETIVEVIEVHGAPAETLAVRETIYGPIVARSHAGLPLALMWTAHHAAAVNTGLVGMESAGTLEEAIAVAHQSGIPVQNALIAASDGRIAWTPMGRIPKRADNYDPRFPADWSSLGSGWQGWLADAEVPAVVAPESGRLWTANARNVGGSDLRKLGDGGYTIGARARQIRDGLNVRERLNERDLFAIQLDDRALFLERWRGLLENLLVDQTDPDLVELRNALDDWNGHAHPNLRSYRLVRDFRLRVQKRFLQLFDAPLREADSSWTWPSLAQIEGVVWLTIQDRPAHLLPANFASWDAWLLACARDSLKRLDQLGTTPAKARWGELNTSAIRHPISRAVPILGWWLDMPKVELSGDQYMPRVQGPSFGASERMVVSPGREAEGILQMPGGQSGHPLSPFYGSGHEDWQRGRPSPFLPGPLLHRIDLVPDAAASP